MKKQKNKIENQNIEMGNLFKIILIILVFFGIFYILTYYIQENKKNDQKNLNDNSSVPIIQYEEILIGNMLEQNENEYYVLIVQEDDYKTRYKEYLKQYSNQNKFYYSYINNGLNKRYISDSSNLNVSNVSELRIKENTLLKISSKKVVESYEGNSKIMEKFIELNK